MTMRDASPLDELIESLEVEKAQEKRATGDADSPFADAPAEEVWVERAREYDDKVKHLVRKRSWLKTAKNLRDEKGSGLRVLTLPGRYRLEIELYRKNGVLDDDRDQLEVVGFESSPEIFGLLNVMQPPLERLFFGDLVKALGDPDGEIYPELAGLFPFDIVNLDLTVNLITQSDAPYAPVLKAIRECIRLQTPKNGEWALMLTFRWDPSVQVNPDSFVRLKEEFDSNLKQHPAVRKACGQLHNVTTGEAFYTQDPEEAIARFAAKWVVDQAHAFEWRVKRSEQIRYDRETPAGSYSIRKIVLVFKRGSISRHDLPGKAIPTQTWQVEDLETVVGVGRTTDYDERLAALGDTERAALQAELDQLKIAADPDAPPQSRQGSGASR
jgi:hypothetical protein